MFYKAHRDPVPKDPAAVVLRPLFFDFPDDSNTYEIDKQFMVGGCILISPVLEAGNEKNILLISAWHFVCFFSQNLLHVHKLDSFLVGASTIQIYIPSGVWYDWYDWQVVTDEGKMSKSLSVGDDIPVRIPPFL